ncbi:MAG: hypothetical protein HC836_43760 [Richelia sp. RM2_1_2]|nr:hypothetical protein [Richelia sp. RM2_1_2]
MEQHINVFNSLNNFKTIVGKLIASPMERQYAEVGDLVDIDGKLVFIESNEILISLVNVSNRIKVLRLEVVNKSGVTLVKHELMSNTFKRVIALNRVRIDSLVVVVTKNSDTTTTTDETPELMINKDGFAVIKHYVGKSFRKDVKNSRHSIQ